MHNGPLRQHRRDIETHPSSQGSPEYREARPGLAHHYAHNSHHPEHYENGIAGMDLLDLVEMFCDWKAASERNPTDGVKIDHNARIYAIAPQLAQILENTVARWPTETTPPK